LAPVSSYTLLLSSAFADDYKGSPRKDLKINVDAGTIYAPAFLGSKDYQLMAVPNISVKYKDQFFASIQHGVGFNSIRSNGWCVSPIAKYTFERKENADIAYVK